MFAECCFVKYATLEEANAAIDTLNGQYTFSGVSLNFLPAQIKFLPSLVPNRGLTIGSSAGLGILSH